jgi:serine protease Do
MHMIDRPGKTVRGAFVALLLAGTAVGGFAVGGHFDAQAQSDATFSVQPKQGAIEPGQISHPLPDFVSLVKEVKPAVVSITSKMRPEEEEQGGGMPGFGGQGQQFPFPFPFPFAQQQQPHRLVEARGSGFLIDANGTIVTNNHVVKNATSVTVTLDDGTTLPAKVIGHDARSDLAVLKVTAHHPLPFINLGDSNAAQPGAWVIAVGNPFGLGGTVTAGIVSARGRDIGEGPYDSFIQIDAPINQGNSGGPLFTQDGKVVGVNSAIISPSGGSVGIGFAIPSNTVKSVVAQLEKSGHVTRGYIGVEAQAVSQAMADALHLPAASSDDRGALVASVEPDSPAGHAGMQPGDVIVQVNGEHVGNARELAIDVSQTPPGNHATVAILRNGKPQTLDVVVGTLPSDGAAHGGVSAPDSSRALGVALSPITPQLRQQLDLGDGQRGVVITQVQQGSAAEQAGLQAGDVIVGVGDRNVSTTLEASRAIHDSLKQSQAVALRIIRNGEPIFVAVAPAQGGDQGGDSQDDGNG